MSVGKSRFYFICVAAALVGVLLSVLHVERDLPTVSETNDKNTGPTSTTPASLKGKLVRDYYAGNVWKLAKEETYGVSKIYEISEFPPHIYPSDEQIEAAVTLRKDAFKHATNMGWFNYENGIKAGYRLTDQIDALHYMNAEYVADGRELDPQRPEALMYYPTKKGIILAGFMFLTNNVLDAPKQIGGNLTRWHVHKWSDKDFCWSHTLPKGLNVDCSGEHETLSKFSPPMLHVWFVDHPDGPFSTEMCLPAHVIGEKNTFEYLAAVNNFRSELLRRQNDILSTSE